MHASRTLMPLVLALWLVGAATDAGAGDPREPEPWGPLPRVSVSVTLRLPDGRPAAGARVFLQPFEAEYFAEWALNPSPLDSDAQVADAAGLVRFPRAPAETMTQIFIDHPEAAPARYQLGAFRAGGATELQPIRLRPAVRVAGTVTNDLGEPLPHLPIEAECDDCLGFCCAGGETRTDEDGNYTFRTSLGSHDLRVSGLVSQSTGVRRQPGPVQCDIVVPVRRSFTGVVVHEDGSPVPDASVQLNFHESKDLPSVATVTDANGRFRLLTLGFRPAELVVERGLACRAQDIPTSTAMPERVVLARGADLTMRPRFPPDVANTSHLEPIIRVTINEGEPRDDGVEARFATWDVHLDHVPVGQPIRIACHFGGGFDTVRRTITLQPGEHRIVHLDASSGKSRALAVEVRDPDGNPIPDAQVIARKGHRIAESDEDGQCVVHVPIPDDADPAIEHADIRVQHDDYLRAEVGAPLAGSEPVLVVLRPAARVSLKVHDSTGQPVPVARSWARKTGPEGVTLGCGFWYAETTHALPQPIRHGKLEAGLYAVRAETKDGHTREFSVELESGQQQDLEWVLPDPFTVKVEIHAPGRPEWRLFLGANCLDDLECDVKSWQGWEAVRPGNRDLSLRYAGRYELTVWDSVLDRNHEFTHELWRDTGTVVLQLPPE